MMLEGRRGRLVNEPLNILDCNSSWFAAILLDEEFDKLLGRERMNFSGNGDLGTKSFGPGKVAVESVTIIFQNNKNYYYY